MFNAKWVIFSAISMPQQVTSWWNDDDYVRLVLDQYAELNLYSSETLKQQSAGRYVPSLGHVILIPRQPVFALSPLCSNKYHFVVFVFTWTWFEPTLLSGEEQKIILFGSNPWSTTLRGEHANQFTTDASEFVLKHYFYHINMCGQGRKSNSQQ